jgi:hypothetical protein
MAVRIVKVDRAEVFAVEHRRRLYPVVEQPLAPRALRLVVLDLQVDGGTVAGGRVAGRAVPEAAVVVADETEPLLVQESAQPVPSSGLADE